jgi:DNA-binding Lrp family transcriptional regulator
MQLDMSDRKLLNQIQTAFPLTGEPFAELARLLGTGADEVTGSIARLKEAGVIRLIGPVLDSGSLGYQTTLVAMRVKEANLERAEEVIAGHPGVSHGYEREHRFNVWFTLALPAASDIETELQKLTYATGADIALSLPAVKTFKIGAYFDMDVDGQTAPAAHREGLPTRRVELSGADRLIINELQQDLALVPAPFSLMAERAGMDLEQFLAGCRSLQERGIMRRFSASINHRNAGFTANAMSCWAVSTDKLDMAGQKLASMKEVSHCYQRKTNRRWHYNLFAMIHGRRRERCREIAEKVSHQTGLSNYALLYSTKEFKKTRVRYAV